MLKRNIRIELDSLLNELKMNLANNYKDLAHDALNKLHETLEQRHDSGELKDKDYNKYKRIADDYSARMADYHH